MKNPEKWNEIVSIFARINELIDSGACLYDKDENYIIPSRYVVDGATLNIYQVLNERAKIILYTHSEEWDHGFDTPLETLKERWFSKIVVIPKESTISLCNWLNV